jgi:ribosomal protein S18 acetylase RimI-like enzyme
MTPKPQLSKQSSRPTQIHVRAADLDDARDGKALLMLLDAYARDPMGEGRGLSREARACLLPALRRVPGALVLLAFARTEDAASVAGQDWPPVGAAVCFFGFSTFRARALLNVHDLAVLPDSRRRGVGRRLLAAVETVARSHGCCKVTLEVRADNASARRLYDRLGYGAGTAAGDPAQYLFIEKRLED